MRAKALVADMTIDEKVWSRTCFLEPFMKRYDFDSNIDSLISPPDTGRRTGALESSRL